jgi:stage II sporulation protein E
MAGLVEEWTKARINRDEKSKMLMAQIVYQAKEKGLLMDELHIYEENKRLCVEGYVYCKWNGGIPVKHYLAAVEKALRKPMRMGKDTKTILTQEPVFLSLYEDTKYYGLQGIATEKKTGSFINGNSYSF